MLLASRTFTCGDTRRQQLDYSPWLDNAASIVSATLSSSSTTLLVQNTTIAGPVVTFFVTGGAIGETATVSVAMRDSFDNIKNDTVAYTVVAP